MDQLQSNQWLREMMAAHETSLRRFLTRIVPLAVANEIIQEAFFKLLGQKTEVIENHVAEWLFTVCRNKAWDYLRKEKNIDSDELPRLELVAVDPAPLPIQVLESRQQLALILKSIARLKPQEQEVVRLKFQEGFDYKEISRITGHSISYVGVLIHQSIQKIRKDVGSMSVTKGVKNETGT